MNELLIDERPIVVSREMAAEIGLNQAIAILRLERLCSTSDEAVDGQSWIFTTLPDLTKQFFPWWSEAEVEGVIDLLERNGYIAVGDFDGYEEGDLWITINYENLVALLLDLLGCSREYS